MVDARVRILGSASPARALLLALACAAGGCGGDQDSVAMDDDAIEEGGAVVAGRLCASCHGTDLSGGSGPYPGTQVHPPNLTPDETGVGAWSDPEIIAAILDGIDPDGRQLCNAMPVYRSMGMTEDQAAAVVAYLRSLAPVEHAVPEPISCRE